MDRAGALRKLEKFSFARPGPWALKLVQHAVSTGAQQIEVWDEGENLDESVGLCFRYDSVEPGLQELESALGIVSKRKESPIVLNHLSYALLGAMKSGPRLGPIRLRPTSAFFAANVEGRRRRMDLLTGQWGRWESREQKWTYSLNIDRQRPLFGYSLSGHVEIREIISSCAWRGRKSAN